MVFWIGILVAVAFAYSAIKMGFYQTWTMLFNIVIAVYVGVRLGPAIEEFIPAGGQYSKMLAVLTPGVGTFLILQGIAYIFLIGQFLRQYLLMQILFRLLLHWNPLNLIKQKNKAVW